MVGQAPNQPGEGLNQAGLPRMEGFAPSGDNLQA